MRWFLLKNRRHQGPYSVEQLRKDLDEGRMRARDFLISLENVDAGNLEYRPLYEILGLPAPSAEATIENRTASPGQSSSQNSLPSSGSGESQGSGAIARHSDSPTRVLSPEFKEPIVEPARTAFEGADAVDFIVHQVPTPGPNFTPPPPPPPAKAVLFEEDAGRGAGNGIFHGPVAKGLGGLLLVGGAFAAYEKFFPKSRPEQTVEREESAARIERREPEPAATSVNSSQRRVREAAPLRVPEPTERRSERPALAAPNQLPGNAAPPPLDNFGNNAEPPTLERPPVGDAPPRPQNLEARDEARFPPPPNLNNPPPEIEQNEFIPPPVNEMGRAQPSYPNPGLRGEDGPGAEAGGGRADPEDGGDDPYGNDGGDI